MGDLIQFPQPEAPRKWTEYAENFERMTLLIMDELRREQDRIFEYKRPKRKLRLMKEDANRT